MRLTSEICVCSGSTLCAEILLKGTALFWHVFTLLKISIEKHFYLTQLWNTRWCFTMFLFWFPTFLISTSHFSWLSVFPPSTWICSSHIFIYKTTFIFPNKAWLKLKHEQVQVILTSEVLKFWNLLYFLWCLALKNIYVLILQVIFQWNCLETKNVWFQKKLLVGRYTDTE